MNPRMDGEGDLESDASLDRELGSDLELDQERGLGSDLEGEAGISGALEGEGDLLEGEADVEFGSDPYLEGEDELGAEPFLKPLRRRFRGILRRAAPLLKNVARIAAPRIATLVGGAFGGPLGASLGGSLGRLAANALRESDLEYELEYESIDGEDGAPGLDAEVLAALAARAGTEAESEALSGAAVVSSLTPAARRLLRHALPHMVRATSLVAGLLYRQPLTRPAIRVLPAIVRGTARMVAASARAGSAPTPALVARAMARQTARHLVNPDRTAATIARNARATAVARQRRTL